VKTSSIIWNDKIFRPKFRTLT